MAWVWCAALSSWVAHVGAVPAGRSYPLDGTNEPDLSGILPAGGEIDLWSASAGTDPCSGFSPFYTEPHVAYYDSGGVHWQSFSPFGQVSTGGEIPAGTDLFVIVSGPNWDNTDPQPAWATSVPLGWLIPTPQYQVRVVARDATPYGTVPYARVNRVSWELNGPGAAEISLATTDPDAARLVAGREVQIFYRGSTDPIFWGPIVRIQGGLDETTWECAGLLWYFQHRFMGRADRVNQLTNGGFESSETGWSFSGVTHSVNTNMTYVLEGTKSEKLTGATADHDTYASQTWTHPAGGYPGGDALVVSAWVYVPSADYVGGAISDFGLVGRHKRGATILNAQFAEINDDTAKNEWVPLEVVLAGVIEGDTIDVLLFPPHGVAYYDVVTLTFMESLSFGYPTAVDASEIIGGIVDYAQDHNPPGFNHGKSDLLIDTAIPTVGVSLQRAYQFAEHRNIADALAEFTRMGIVDYDIVFTATTRTFTGYVPRKGDTYGTTLELDTNVADFTYSWDGEQAASSVVLLGPGDGPDRPEGGAVGTDIGGAWSSEIVESAPDDATIGQLDDRAEEVLKVHQYPGVVEVITLPGAGIIGNLTIGDFAPIHIERGWVDIEAADDPPYRVVRIEADLLNDQATYTLNRYPT